MSKQEGPATGAEILLVEDNIDNMELMQFLLNAFGYWPAQAASGAEGVRLARDSHPDLILMDIQMADMDGYAACRDIRREPGLEQCRIVAVTAFAMAAAGQQILSSGFDGCLTKPIVPETFVSQVEAFLPRELRVSSNPLRSTHVS